MASSDDRSVILRLSIQQLSQPNLLAGLDNWRQLGLLSDRQIFEFAEEYLICPAPARSVEAAGSFETATADDFVPIDVSERQPVPAAARSVGRSVRSTSSPPPSLVSRTLQSFMAEVSVVWLLFLGVFLVVVSSGVLAASQWQNFSIVGQYGILFAYTLAFAAVGLWTGRRSQLRLTSRMLQIATLLIIPVNFWMIDGLRLSSSPAGLGLAAIAALSLTAVNFLLLRPGNGLVSGDRSMLTVVNAIGLSWLHLGWSGFGGGTAVPLIATYIGTIGTAVLTLRQFSRDRADATQSTVAPLVLALATLLLLGRAVLGAGVAVSQLGLALGICGWLLGWMIQRDRLPVVWGWAALTLLLLGWGVSVSAEPPWQAIAVSLLGLWLLLDRLTAHADSVKLVAIGLIGLQAYVLLWQLVPLAVRQNLLDWVSGVASDRGMPWALTGLGVFPYVLLLLGLAAWLRRRGVDSAASAKLSLVQQTELMALMLGLALTWLSLANPLLRSLNLTLSALTLAAVLRRRSPHLSLLYLLHLVTVGAALSWVDWRFPGWDALAWARLLLLAMAIEWGFSLAAGSRRWQNVAWHLGLGLATISYLLLYSRLDVTWIDFIFWSNAGKDGLYASLIWLLTSMLLTGLSRSPRFAATRSAAGISSGALVAQLLLVPLPRAWLISLSVGTLLMWINTHKLRSTAAALLTVGFGLGVEAFAIYEGFGDRLTADGFSLLLAATLWVLWLLRGWLAQYQTTLSLLYSKATNRWAIALCSLTLLWLMLITLFDPSWAIALAASLTIGAIAYWLWQQPTNLGFYGIAWGAGVLAVLLVRLNQGNLETMAIALLGLGLVSQFAGDVWVRRSQSSYRSSWHVIPPLYAALGWLTAHGVAFDRGYVAETGLYTFAMALVGVGVGRRLPALKPLTLLSMLLFSVGAYELLIYQLLQAKGGSPGDGMALLAGLAALLAFVMRLAARWLLPYLRLALPEIRAIAHWHWALGSGLALLALPLPLSTVGRLFWAGTTGLLAGYALGNGRIAEHLIEPESSESSALTRGNFPILISSPRSAWTYAGIWQGLMLVAQALHWTVPDRLLLGWAGAIAAVISVGLYFLPWQRWGWTIEPWRNTAVGLPLAIVFLTLEPVLLQSLLIVAAFYAWLSKSTRQPRLSYLAILLLDWSIVRYLWQQNSLTLLWLGAVLGGSLLYVAQIDPALRSASGREQRHWLRSLATGLICLTALYQAEIETGTIGFWVGLLALGLGLAFVLLGILLRVRAFLYIGTAVFILRVLRLLWLFVSTYSLLLWAIGIVLGLLFIWVAANFEARRSQMNALLQYWMTELESWE